MLDDPANKFVDEISQGYAPKELVGQDGKAPEIDIVDKRSESRQQMSTKVQIFEGSGVSLGGSKKKRPVAPFLPLKQARSNG